MHGSGFFLHVQMLPSIPTTVKTFYNTVGVCSISLFPVFVCLQAVYRSFDASVVSCKMHTVLLNKPCCGMD